MNASALPPERPRAPEASPAPECPESACPPPARSPLDSPAAGSFGPDSPVPGSPAPKKRLRRRGLATGLLLAVLVLPYLYPHSLRSVLPGFDPSQVTECRVDYFEGWTADSPPNHRYQQRSIDPASPEFAELVALLDSTRYRLQLSNLFTGGALGSYSVTLEPYAELTFTQGDTTYEIALLGRDIPMGTVSQSGKKDYSAYGGMEFQKRVVDFAASHGTLVKEETL